MEKPTNNFLYSILEDEYILEGQAHTGFGIIITSTISNEVVAKIEDITTSKYKLCTLVQLCNDISLNPIHIYDVVEDFLS